MSIEIKVPVLGESVVEATVAKWMKNVGEKVNADEPIVELETDKVSLEVPSPKAGVLTDIVAKEGDTVEVDAILALLQEGAVAAAESKQPIENKNEEKIQPQAANLSPAVRRLVEENNLDASSIPASGKDGRLTKGDVLSFLEKEVSNVPSSSSAGSISHISEACIAGLREFPAVNAEINGNDIIYKDYYNIGVAVGTPQGLVVPVIKDAHDLSIAEIETSVAGYGLKARDGGLAPSDMSGGTFTISNGGVYGSLMSTPILNTPQSAILGMHKIQKRPIAVGDEIVIRPMMYLALSYDHRIIDGREAVSFLVRVKESIEDPRRLLLDI